MSTNFLKLSEIQKIIKIKVIKALHIEKQSIETRY